MVALNRVCPARVPSWARVWRWILGEKTVARIEFKAGGFVVLTVFYPLHNMLNIPLTIHKGQYHKLRGVVVGGNVGGPYRILDQLA